METQKIPAAQQTLHLRKMQRLQAVRQQIRNHFDKKDENTVYGKNYKSDGNTITYEVLERQDNGAMPQGSKAPGALPSRKAHHRHKRTIAIQTVIRSQRARHRQNRKEVPIHRQVEHLREKDDKGKRWF